MEPWKAFFRFFRIDCTRAHRALFIINRMQIRSDYYFESFLCRYMPPLLRDDFRQAVFNGVTFDNAIKWF